MTRIVFPVWALAAWSLTVVLVSQLLGGTFEARSCQSACVWVLYWSAFAVAVAGCAAGVWWFLKSSDAKSPLALASVGAMLLLLVIFIATMAIGEFA